MKTPNDRTGTAIKPRRLTGTRKPQKVSQILVPVDFSPGSREALTFAAAIAEQLDSKVTVVHIVEPLPTMDTPAVSATLSHGRDLCEARQSLDMFASREVDSEHLAGTQVLVGKPYEQILRLAKGMKPGLIVLAARSYGKTAEAILGSTTDRLVRLAPCPVLIVPSAK